MVFKVWAELYFHLNWHIIPLTKKSMWLKKLVVYPILDESTTQLKLWGPNVENEILGTKVRQYLHFTKVKGESRNLCYILNIRVSFDVPIKLLKYSLSFKKANVTSLRIRTMILAIMITYNYKSIPLDQILLYILKIFYCV